MIASDTHQSGQQYYLKTKAGVVRKLPLNPYLTNNNSDINALMFDLNDRMPKALVPSNIDKLSVVKNTNIITEDGKALTADVSFYRGKKHSK